MQINVNLTSAIDLPDRNYLVSLGLAALARLAVPVGVNVQPLGAAATSCASMIK